MPPPAQCATIRLIHWGDANRDMPLESLLKLAETLKERASVHDVALKGNEALTRYALIDPLLRELGWDTSDPSAVVPEYSSGSRRVDYALMVSSRPAVMVEAKKLGTPLRDHVSQGILYCIEEGTKHFTITDGARWEIYRAFIPDTPIDERRIVEFDLSTDSPAVFCLNALALWRPSVESGSVAAGQPSVIEKEQPIVISPSPIPPGDWRPLTDIGNVKRRKPAEMLFPDNSQANLKIWADVPLETVRWLSRKGQLVKANCSIKNGPNAKRYIAHTSPIHSDGKRFKQPHKVNGFWMEGDTSVGVPRLISNAVTLIEHVGQDPSQFRVRFA